MKIIIKINPLTCTCKDEHASCRILVVVYRCVQWSAAMHVHTVQCTPMLNKQSCQGSIPKETRMMKRAAASKEQTTSTTGLAG